MFTPPQSTIRELDHRSNDDVEVRLLWNSRTDRLFVAVEDRRASASFVFTVPADEARDAFCDPYAHSGRDLLPIITTDAA
jgi:hypothetical protein